MVGGYHLFIFREYDGLRGMKRTGKPIHFHNMTQK